MSSYELAVKVVEGDIHIAVYFKRRVERRVKPRRPRAVMTINICFDDITLAVFTASRKMVKLSASRHPLKIL